MQLNDLRYIAVEGVIGVGKTSLADLLARKLSARLILEEFEENPFLADFYKDRRAYAFQAQMFFLLSRYRQQENIVQYDLFQQQLVADYMFNKDRIFALQTLDEKEMSLYNMLAGILEKRIVKPDLAIYLQASTNHLMSNITKRGRVYEKDMSEEYIDSLNTLYDEFFRVYDSTPLLIINTDNLDFVNDDKHLQKIFAEISKHRIGRKVVTIDI